MPAEAVHPHDALECIRIVRASRDMVLDWPTLPGPSPDQSCCMQHFRDTGWKLPDLARGPSTPNSQAFACIDATSGNKMMRCLTEVSAGPSCRPTSSSRALVPHVRPSQPRMRHRCSAVITTAAAAVETKQQSRLAFVDLQPPDPILGEQMRPAAHCKHLLPPYLFGECFCVLTIAKASAGVLTWHRPLCL
jgi:hypothetical protein